jgi:epoxide hydrolase-like predicted phosphatase
MTAVRAVVLDVGGVLELPADTGLDGRWERRLGLPRGAFFERLRRSGLGRAANLGRVSEAGLARGLAALYGLDERATGELLDDLWDWYAGRENTEMVEHLRRLRTRYRTAILSNAAAGGHRREQARHGFDELADVAVYSYQVGIEKPDPRIYLLTCRRLGVRPAEAVFLDDLEANVAGARQVGMRAVRFRHTAQAIAEVEACLAGRTG